MKKVPEEAFKIYDKQRQTMSNEALNRINQRRKKNEL